MRASTVLLAFACQLALYNPTLQQQVSDRCSQNSVTPVSCADVNSHDGLVPHPDDCNLFYYCIQPSLPPVCRQCPANLHFNPVLHVCDWPYQAGCKVNTTEDVTEWVTKTTTASTTASENVTTNWTESTSEATTLPPIIDGNLTWYPTVKVTNSWSATTNGLDGLTYWVTTVNITTNWTTTIGNDDVTWSTTSNISKTWTTLYHDATSDVETLIDSTTTVLESNPNNFIPWMTIASINTEWSILLSPTFNWRTTVNATTIWDVTLGNDTLNWSTFVGVNSEWTPIKGNISLNYTDMLPSDYVCNTNIWEHIITTDTVLDSIGGTDDYAVWVTIVDVATTWPMIVETNNSQNVLYDSIGYVTDPWLT